MRKMFQLLIVLFLIYFGIEFLYNFFGNGHDIKYTMSINETEYNIHEVLSLNTKEKDNYLIEISLNDIVIPFKIFNSYSKRQKIVSDITYISSNGYDCFALKLNEDDNPSDIKCRKGNTVYFYYDIAGNYVALDNKIKETGYDNKQYTSDLSNSITKFTNLEVYPNNFPKKSYMILEAYKGVYLMGSEVNNYVRTFQFFNQDVYNIDISAIVDKYYLVANYNASHEFNEFNVINLRDGSNYKFKVDNYISFNSFVQGSYDNKLYIIDKDAKVQYSIDPVAKTSTILNDLNNNVEVYINGKKEIKSITDVINNKLVFTNNSNEYQGKSYAKVILSGEESHGTYYLFEENEGKYDVYAVYTNSNERNYVFTTTSKDRVQISDEYIYYIDDDKIMVFSPTFGKKVILKHSELKYNNDLKYLVY